MKKDKEFYEPIKEQFQILIEYINIIEYKKSKKIEDIVLLIDFMNTIMKQCELYLKFGLIEERRNTNDRNIEI
jgi:hypothetical protein